MKYYAVRKNNTFFVVDSKEAAEWMKERGYKIDRVKRTENVEFVSNDKIVGFLDAWYVLNND